MKTAHLMRAAWWSWGIAVMLLVSGPRATTALSLVLLAAGFVLTGLALARGLLGPGKRHRGPC